MTSRRVNGKYKLYLSKTLRFLLQTVERLHPIGKRHYPSVPVGGAKPLLISKEMTVAFEFTMAGLKSEVRWKKGTH